jgi:hypothetical protein
MVKASGGDANIQKAIENVVKSFLCIRYFDSFVWPRFKSLVKDTGQINPVRFHKAARQNFPKYKNAYKSNQL